MKPSKTRPEVRSEVHWSSEIITSNRVLRRVTRAREDRRAGHNSNGAEFDALAHDVRSEPESPGKARQGHAPHSAISLDDFEHTGRVAKNFYLGFGQKRFTRTHRTTNNFSGDSKPTHLVRISNRVPPDLSDSKFRMRPGVPGTRLWTRLSPQAKSRQRWVRDCLLMRRRSPPPPDGATESKSFSPVWLLDTVVMVAKPTMRQAHSS